MPEWKDTVNLPRTDFPMKANLQTTEPQVIARWDETGLYQQIRAAAPAPPKFVLHDGPPYANGDIHIGHRAQQDPQGLRGQVASDGRVRRAVRARLGLPRPADRAEGRPRARSEEARTERRRLPPGLPCLRLALGRRDARGLRAPGRLRRVGASVSDDELRATRRRSSGPSARSSSRGSSTRARSRSTGASTAGRRWPRPRSSTRITPRRRSTSSSRSTRRARTSWPPACRNWRDAVSRPHLDDDPVDDSVESRARVPPGFRLRRVRAGATASCSSPRGWPTPWPRRPAEASVRQLARVHGRTLDRLVFRHPLYDRPSLGGARRLRHARAGHGRRAHGARSWRRRLSDRREVRPRHLRSGRPGRTLHRRGGDVRGHARLRRQPAQSRRRSPNVGGSGTARRSSTAIRTAGVATTR